jgi:hypothetical protein
VGGALLEACAAAVEEGVDGSLAPEQRIDALGDGAALVRVEVALRPEDVVQRAVGQPALVSHRAVRLQRRLDDEVLPQRPLRPALEGARHLRSRGGVARPTRVSALRSPASLEGARHLRSAGDGGTRGISRSCG